MADYVFAPPPVVSLAVVGRSERFALRRVYCVGRNYVEHAIEMGHSGREAPFFFLKPTDAVLPAAVGETLNLPYPPLTHDFQHEVELVVAIGKGGRDIAPEQAMQHVFGCAIGLDMTRRDLQGEAKKQGRPWEIGKAADHSAPIGPLTPLSQCGPLTQGGIALSVNGRTVQKSDLSKLIWSVSEVIAHLSTAWTLKPGDVIMTGTPEGVGAVQCGDELLASAAGVTPLSVKII